MKYNYYEWLGKVLVNVEYIKQRYSDKQEEGSK